MRIPFVFAALLCTVFPVTASAQSPGASESSTESALGQMISSAPHPGESGISGTFGLQRQSGPTETFGWSVNGIVAHTTKKRHLLRFDTELSYAKYRQSSSEPFAKVEDNQQASFTYLHMFKKRFAAMSTTSWRRDDVIKLGYRAFVDAGIGMQVLETPKAKAFIGGSYAVGKEDRTYSDRSENVLDYGILQTFVFRPNATMSIEEFLRAHIDSTDSGDRSLQFNVSLATRVTKYAGFKIYYKHQHDALHPATEPATQSEFGVGFMLHFVRGAAPAKP